MANIKIEFSGYLDNKLITGKVYKIYDISHHGITLKYKHSLNDNSHIFKIEKKFLNYNLNNYYLNSYKILNFEIVKNFDNLLKNNTLTEIGKIVISHYGFNENDLNDKNICKLIIRKLKLEILD